MQRRLSEQSCAAAFVALKQLRIPRCFLSPLLRCSRKAENEGEPLFVTSLWFKKHNNKQIKNK